MSALFKKLQWSDQNEVFVLNAPASFEPVCDELEQEDIEILRDLPANGTADFVIMFVTEKQQIDRYAPGLVATLTDDPTLWFAYPKLSSKNIESDITRDDGWEKLSSLGYKPVRQVAIDEDWSALRFRPQHLVKTRN